MCNMFWILRTSDDCPSLDSSCRNWGFHRFRWRGQAYAICWRDQLTSRPSAGCEYQCCHHSEIRITVDHRLMRRTTTWNSLHRRLCLNLSRKRVLYPLHIVMFVTVGSSRFVAHFATVQTLCSLTIRFTSSTVSIGSVFHTKLTCPRSSPHCTSSWCPATQSFRRFVGVSRNVHHLAHTSKSEWSPRRDHQLAPTLLLTEVTPRLDLLEGLLDVSNTCDRLLPRNSACCTCLISIAVVTLSSGSLLDNRSLCSVIWRVGALASSSLSSNAILSSIIEMTLMIGLSGIIQRVDHRPSTMRHVVLDLTLLCLVYHPSRSCSPVCWLLQDALDVVIWMFLFLFLCVLFWLVFFLVVRCK